LKNLHLKYGHILPGASFIEANSIDDAIASNDKAIGEIEPSTVSAGQTVNSIDAGIWLPGTVMAKKGSFIVAFAYVPIGTTHLTQF
jgi:hypothetical protein